MASNLNFSYKKCIFYIFTLWIVCTPFHVCEISQFFLDVFQRCFNYRYRCHSQYPIEAYLTDEVYLWHRCALIYQITMTFIGSFITRWICNRITFVTFPVLLAFCWTWYFIYIWECIFLELFNVFTEAHWAFNKMVSW